MGQREITAALERRRGMQEDHAKRLAEFNAKQTDWFTTCPLCKRDLRGSIAQLKEHKCGSEG